MKLVLVQLHFRGTLDPAQLVERYAATTGRDIRDMVLYLAFARFKLGVIVQQIYYRYVHGQCALLPPCQGMVAILMRSALKCAESENQCPPVRLRFSLMRSLIRAEATLLEEELMALVLNGVASARSIRSYRTGLEQFFA